MALTLTPIWTDNFTPNANPLNPVNYSVVTNTHITAVALQALSGVCNATVADGLSQGQEQLIGASIPNDCYVTITNAGGFGTLGSFQNFSAGVRVDTVFANFEDGWYVQVIDEGDGVHVTLEAFVQYGNGTANFNFYQNTAYTPTINDVYTLAVIGTKGYFFLNGIFKSGADAASVSPRGSGATMLTIFAPTLTSQTSFKTFIAGSASGSIPLGPPGGGDLGPGYDFKFRM